MSEFQIPYGKTQLTFTISDSFHTQVLAPAQVPPPLDSTKAVYDALDSPVGGVHLRDFARAESVAIVINDKTRPVPLKILLPPLMQRLAQADIADGAITFIIGVGTHVPMPREEFASVVPADILARYRIISHDCDDRANHVELGTTSYGTRVEVNRVFAQADLRIAIGDIEPHQFMGFSGGVKSAAIGVTSRETINHNHAMLMDARAYQGRYDDNPVRQDVEEIGKMMGVHFTLNSVIGEDRQIVGVFAGNPVAVMHAGMPLALDVYRVTVAAPFDLMIVSSGGHPKDINMYQGQKGLGHAIPVVKKGGTVILVSACPEGSGSKIYEEYVQGFSSYEALVEHFKREPFRLGRHKAFQIARDATKARLLIVTEMPPELTKRLLLTRCESLDAALAIALRDLPRDARVGVVPVGNVTIPVLTADD